MADLLTLVNEALRRTGQVEATTLANAQTPIAQARDFLNETYHEMLQRLKVDRLLKQSTLNTVNGTAAYTLATDAEVNSLIPDSVFETSSGQQLRQVDYSFPMTQGMGLEGRPEAFYIQGSQLHLYPVPDAAYAIQYHYLIKPVSLTSDSDVTALPEEWEKILVLGTQARLEKFLGESAQETYLLYRDGLTQLKSRAILKQDLRMKGFFKGSQS